MTKAKKTKSELKEFLSEFRYSLGDAVQLLLFLVVGLVGILSAFFGAVFLAAAPMFYWSPWWGLISIPGTLIVTIALLLWRFDR